MKMRSAVLFAVGTFAGGVLGEMWRESQDAAYAPELGFQGAVMGLALFGVLWTLWIYVYAFVAQAIRKEGLVRAYIPSAMAGLPMWPVLMPLHELLRDRLALPDGIWWIGAVVFCAVAFEVIRFLSRRFESPGGAPSP